MDDLFNRLSTQQRTMGIAGILMAILLVAVWLGSQANKKQPEPFFAVSPKKAAVVKVFLSELDRKYQGKYKFSWEKGREFDGMLLVDSDFVVPDILSEIVEITAIKEGLKSNMDKVIPRGEPNTRFRIAFRDRLKEVLRIIVSTRNVRNYEEKSLELLPVKTDLTSDSVKIGNTSGEDRRMVLVIDDFGYDKKKAELFASLGNKLTYAVIPLLTYSKEIADYLLDRDLFVIMHMPMEPRNAKITDPGPGALFVDDSAESLKEKISVMMNDLSRVSGVNNHMGSKMTSDETKLGEVMAILKELNLPFLDSRTTPVNHSKKIAQRLGMAYAERDIFLDDEVDKEKIRYYWEKAKRLTKKKSPVIVIGHPFTETYELLKEEIPKLESSGIRLVTLDEALQVPKN